MASITQTIPQYNGGISQQPDEKKLPGQVIEAKNVLPDITSGLLKRPGGKLIGSLSDGDYNSQTNGRWFHYYRDENEQYIGQISRTGDVNIWRCSDGAEMTVVNDTATSAALVSYLTHTNDEDLQTLTLNDYTYVTNRTKTIAMGATVEPTRPPEAFIQLNKVAYANQYSVNLFDDTSTTTRTSATRVSVLSSRLNTESSCPDVGTEIFNVGTEDDVHENIKQEFIFKNIHGAHEGAINFFETDDDTTYQLFYCPPEWTTNTFYRVNDLVTGRPDAGNNNAHLSVYKLTSITDGYTGNSTGTDLPTATGGGTTTLGNFVWTHISDDIYSNDQASQTHHNKPCLKLTHAAIQVNSTATLTSLIGVWKNTTTNPHYTHLPFVFDDQEIFGSAATTETASFGLVWKHFGYYDDHLTRIIIHRPNGIITPGAPPTIGGGTSNLITGIGQLEIKTTGWAKDNVLGTGRSDLYFRLTNTGQAVPDTGGDNYSCRYTTTIDLLHGGSGWQVGDKIRIKLKEGTHVIQIDKISTSQVQANLGLVRPTPTSFDTKTTVTAESILGDIRIGILGDSNGGINTLYEFQDDSADEGTDSYNGYQVKQIGNGIYITRPTAQGIFNISSPSGDLLNVLTDSIKDIADLPTQCKHGYVVKVANSEADEDDYYVKFFGHNDKDGEGVWEECPKPGVTTTFDPSTMPIQIVRQADGTFKVEQISWENRLVGDTVTVPEPSFIGKKINKMLFFRNRLVMLSDENVIMSQPGQFFNFWPKSAITFTATDNIDISCSSEYPAIVYDGIQVNSGLVLFTKNQQFMLTTDSDVLSPLTAKINSLSTYNFNYQTNPISLGTTIGFLDNAGKYSRFWEMSQVLREGEPSVIDQTKIVSKLFDKELTQISNSRENGVIFFSKKNSSTLYGFRYFNAGNQRLQQSWFTWETVGTIQHHAVLDDSLYIVVRNNSKDTLQKYSIKTHTDSFTITDDKNNDDATDDVTYRIHLDGASSVTIPADAYNEGENKTVFSKPNGYENTTAQLCLYDNNTTSENVGKYSTASIVNINIEVPGDWSNRTVILGYLYDMEIKLPTIYVTKTENEVVSADTNASLVVHRVKLNFGSHGSYSTTIDRLGKPSYTEIWESPVSDQYLLSNVAIDEEVTKTIPTYERNKNLSITLKSTHPSPATLYSMAWEGDYTSKFYSRV